MLSSLATEAQPCSAPGLESPPQLLRLPTCSVRVNTGSFRPSKCAASESSSGLSPGWLFQEQTWKSSMT